MGEAPGPQSSRPHVSEPGRRQGLRPLAADGWGLAHLTLGPVTLSTSQTVAEHRALGVTHRAVPTSTPLAPTPPAEPETEHWVGGGEGEGRARHRRRPGSAPAARGRHRCQRRPLPTASWKGWFAGSLGGGRAHPCRAQRGLCTRDSVKGLEMADVPSTAPASSPVGVMGAPTVPWALAAVQVSHGPVV